MLVRSVICKAVMSGRRKLRVVATPLNAHGHVNACHGLADELRARGHEVIFLLESDFAGRLAKYGYEERVIENVSVPELQPYLDGEKEFWPSFIEKNWTRFNAQSLKQVEDLWPEMMGLMYYTGVALHDQYKRLIEEIRPDLIIHDAYVNFPVVTASGIPWVWVYSATPHLLLMDPRIPPFHSGFASKSDQREWKAFTEKALAAIEPLMEKINQDTVAKGGQLFGRRLHPLSDFLNLYMMPEVLRYECMEELPENFIGVNGLVRQIPRQKFEIPPCLRDKPGKLIFFSMGSFGCANLNLMTRLLDFLSRIPHRFIVAKGPLEYELPGENMYGERFLPQTAILPLVDLVITHGGNNTITETFYYGKTMIVMPTFFDQMDNAQRIDELGYGIRLNPFTCAEVELSTAIEQLLANTELTERMEKIGTQIRNSNDKQKVVDYIESKLC